MNVVMTDKGEFIEIQGTGEEHPFSAADLQQFLAFAEKGCGELHRFQREIIGSIGKE